MPNRKKKPAVKKRQSAKETFPHFRYYKKSGHPAMITGEHSEKEYKYRKVMHSETEGGRKNERVDPNPDPKDKKPMYIAKRVRHDEKKHFSTWKYPWKYPGKIKKQ